MKLNVNLFKPSGKWAYGGVVEVSEHHAYYSREFKQEVALGIAQFTTADPADYAVVITHRDDYDTDPSHYFAQAMWRVGAFFVD